MLAPRLLPLLLLGPASPAPAPVGPDLGSNTAAVAIAGLAVAAKLAEDECDDVGVSLLSYQIEFLLIEH